MSGPVVAFCGMTHLGLNMAVAGTAKGFRVLAFDPDADRIARFRKGEIDISEPGLTDLIAQAGDRLSFTSQASDLSDADLVYVAPDVPTDDTGASDLSAIQAMLDVVLPVARADAPVVVLSQVPPGFTAGVRREAGAVFYQVETLIFGRAVERALYPERYIVGCDAPEEALPAAFETYLRAFDCPILPMRYASAELAKISINMFLVSSVATTNTLAELCENIGADWEEIAPALRLDARIGPKAYLSPGLGIAGGNLERDLATVVRLGKRENTDINVVEAWTANSARRKNWAWDVLKEQPAFSDNAAARIAVWGLAYKQDTHSTKNSASIALLSHLDGRDVVVHDPVVPSSAAPVPVTAAESPAVAAADADILVIMTPWAIYGEQDLVSVLDAMRGTVIIDPYGMLKAQAGTARGLSYFTIGRAPTINPA